MTSIVHRPELTPTASDRPGHVVGAAVRVFADVLDRQQRGALLRPYTTEAARRWSNLPERVLGRAGRSGLRTSTLNERQWLLLDELLSAATGSGEAVGVDRIRGHLRADDELARHGGVWGYGRGQFTVAVLGDPSGDGRWELQFGGHHLAVGLTYEGGALVGATPAFRGIEPVGPFVQDGITVDPERRLRESCTALLASLGPVELAAARLPGSHADLLLGPGQDDGFPNDHAGLPAASLDDRQRSLVLEVIASFVADVDEVSAASILSGYRQDLPETRVAWSGTRGMTRAGDYLRIDGPRTWIEVSMQAGIVFDEPHPHAVWRDRMSDYGGRTDSR